MKWKMLGAVVALVAGAWSIWWFVGAAAHDRAIGGWLADRRAAGWQAEVAELSTRGFPNRFDTRLTEPALADPRQGWAWSAPFLEVLQLAYAPNAAVLAFPPEQRIAVPGASATLRSTGLRASVRVAPGPALALTRLSAEGEALALEGADWRAAADRLAAHVLTAEPRGAPEPPPPNAYDAHFAAEGVALPQALRDRIDPEGRLPDVARSLRIDLRATLDGPLDRAALERDAPEPLAIELRDLEAVWGRLALKASGSVAADARGYAEGRLTVRAENWREMLDVAVAAGAVSADMAGLIETGLGLLAALSGGDAIEAPLVFSGGVARLGPVPVGAAPRMVSR
jgi:hypothetical protein